MIAYKETFIVKVMVYVPQIIKLFKHVYVYGFFCVVCLLRNSNLVGKDDSEVSVRETDVRLLEELVC